MCYCTLELGWKHSSQEDFPAGLLCHQQDVAGFPETQPQAREMRRSSQREGWSLFTRLQPGLVFARLDLSFPICPR